MRLEFRKQPGRGTVDIAIAETETLARRLGDRIAALGLTGDGASAGGVMIESPLGDLSSAIEQLYAFLRAPVVAEPDEADVLLARLRAATRAAEIFDYRTFHAAPYRCWPRLWRSPACRTSCGPSMILSSPTAAVRLLHAAAHFDSAGLGPYFANVGRIAARSRDVFALAEIAVESAAAVTAAWHGSSCCRIW